MNELDFVLLEGSVSLREVVDAVQTVLGARIKFSHPDKYVSILSTYRDEIIPDKIVSLQSTNRD